MEPLLFAHSFLRWILLMLLVTVTVKAFVSWLAKKPVMVMDRRLTSWTVMAAHIELVIGLIIYFIKFKSYGKVAGGGYSDFNRFFKFEHISMMILAVILITMGSVLSKKAKNENAKHRRIAVFFLLALIVILAAIPWPFREVFSGKQWL